MITIRVFALLSLLFSTVVLGNDTPKWIALVIGNSDYDASIGKLKNPTNDAEDIAIKLKNLNFNVTLLKNATRRDMSDAISGFGEKLKQKDVVGLFYFAGHGIQVGGSNYLIPIRANIANEADIEYESVAADRVLTQMTNAVFGVNYLDRFASIMMAD